MKWASSRVKYVVVEGELERGFSGGAVQLHLHYPCHADGWLQTIDSLFFRNYFLSAHGALG